MPDEVDPSTKEKYSSLLKDLANIKSFADGIILPKDYIWPVDNARLLQPATNVVSDAHKAGLEVYASGFANDNYLSYNYSYDPTKEYLQFIDNAQFSVDGVITDFPATASEAIGITKLSSAFHLPSFRLLFPCLNTKLFCSCRLFLLGKSFGHIS